MSKVKLINKIGEGTEGVVYLAEVNGEACIAKQIRELGQNFIPIMQSVIEACIVSKHLYDVQILKVEDCQFYIYKYEPLFGVERENFNIALLQIY